MPISSFDIPPMPREYYRRHAERLRRLAQDATTDSIREHLMHIAREYDELADGADATSRNPE
jgi:hypothetical protein